MNAILGFILSDKGIIILGVIVAIIILIKILKVTMRRKEQKKERRQSAADRYRDEKLNSQILNAYSDNNKESYVPYEVDYSKSAQEGKKQIEPYETKTKKTSADIMVQIIENTELSERKFAINATKGIKIGSVSGSDISFSADEQYMCELKASNGVLFVRDMLSGSKLILKRKKKTAIIDKNGIKLQSGDQIIMGHVTYSIVIIK